MKTVLGPVARRVVVLLLLAAQGSAWAQSPPPPLPMPPPPADAPVQQPPPSTTGTTGTQQTPAYTPPPMSKSQRELQRRLSLRHYALIGVATVLTGGGIYFGARSRGTRNDAEDARTQREAYEQLIESQRQAKIANYAYAGAGLALVAAVVTYFVSPPTPPPEKGDATHGGLTR